MPWIYILGTISLWGMVPILDKLALGRVEPLTAILIRGITANSILLLFAASTGKLGELTRVDARGAGLVALTGVISWVLGQWVYFKALQLGKASQVVPLCATYPLVAAVLGVLILRERVTVERFAGILLVLAGIWLIKR